MFIFISVIELACGEYGYDIIQKMVDNSDNGRCLSYLKETTNSNNTQQNPHTLNGKLILLFYI